MPAESYVDAIEALLRRYEHLGARALDNGTRLVGRVPHVGSDAYLHVIFAGLSDAELGALSGSLRVSVPGALERFYRSHNGCDFFLGSLSIYGLRTSYARAGDTVWQPYDVRTPNVEERLADAPSDAFFFGFYNSDGSLLYTCASNTSIYRCQRDSAQPVNEWTSLTQCLKAELERLNELFDDDGQMLDDEADTAPPATL